MEKCIQYGGKRKKQVASDIQQCKTKTSVLDIGKPIKRKYSKLVWYCEIMGNFKSIKSIVISFQMKSCTSLLKYDSFA